MAGPAPDLVPIPVNTFQVFYDISRAKLAAESWGDAAELQATILRGGFEADARRMKTYIKQMDGTFQYCRTEVTAEITKFLLNQEYLAGNVRESYERIIRDRIKGHNLAYQNVFLNPPRPGMGTIRVRDDIRLYWFLEVFPCILHQLIPEQQSLSWNSVFVFVHFISRAAAYVSQLGYTYQFQAVICIGCGYFAQVGLEKFVMDQGGWETIIRRDFAVEDYRRISIATLRTFLFEHVIPWINTLERVIRN